MPWAFELLASVFGLVIGSFLNCVIWRLEAGESLWGRSYCPSCRHQLAWYDLVPVLSWLGLRGKCRYCNQKISWQYPLVEICTAGIFLAIYNLQFTIYNQFPSWLNVVFLWYVAASLVVIFAYDLRHYLIPDIVLFPAIVATLFFRVFEHFLHSNLIGNWKLEIGNYFLASLLASGFFLLIFLATRGRGMGFGDVKLALLMGLLLGFPGVLVAVFSAFLLGSVVGLAAMALKKKGLKSQMPFAPFLITGTFIALFWGSQLVNWYMAFLL